MIASQNPFKEGMTKQLSKNQMGRCCITIDMVGVMLVDVRQSFK